MYVDGLSSQGQIGGVCIHFAVLEQRALQVHVDEVVIERKNPTCTDREYVTVFSFISTSYASSTTTSSCRKRLSLIMSDDAVYVDVTMSVHVVDVLSVTRVPQQIHGVRDDGLVRVDVSIASGRGHCIAVPPEARYRIVMDDLLDVRHLNTMVQIPSHQKRREQDFIASITSHEHMPRSRHDVVLFGVSVRDRRVSKCSRNASGTHMSHSIRPNTVPVRTPLGICCDVIIHRA